MYYGHSLLRKLEYHELSKLKLDGTILDLGGTRNHGYHELIRGKHKILVTNMFKDDDCDIAFDLEKKFPIKKEKFDHILCLNVLEHTYNFSNVVSESYRVLRKKGRFVVTVPFLFPVHECPNDYFRYSAQALNKLAHIAGFKNVRITPLGKGIFSARALQLSRLIKIVIISELIIHIGIGLDKIMRLNKNYRIIAEKYPIGYFMVCTKK